MDWRAEVVHKKPTVRGENWKYDPARWGLRLRPRYVARGILLQPFRTNG